MTIPANLGPKDAAKRWLTVSIWQCDPENRIIEELQDALDFSFLASRDIRMKDQVGPGHALFPHGSNESSDDTTFPRIGVEWDHDHPLESLGRNFRLRMMTPKFRDLIAKYRDREPKEGVDYEQVSSKNFDDLLSKTGWVEEYRRSVVSMTMVSGFATGNGARKTAQFLYQAVDAALPIMASAIKQKYRVDVEIEGDPQVNIQGEPTAGGNPWGFEIMLSVRQVKRTFRHRADLAILKTADIYMEKSRSRIFNFT